MESGSGDGGEEVVVMEEWQFNALTRLKEVDFNHSFLVNW